MLRKTAFLFLVLAACSHDDEATCDKYFISQITNVVASKFYYNADGKLLVEEKTIGDHTTRDSYAYDQAGKLKEVISTNPDGSEYSRHRFHFNSSGQLTSTGSTQTPSPTDSLVISYDNQGRVAHVDIYGYGASFVLRYHSYSYSFPTIVRVDYYGRLSLREDEPFTRTAATEFTLDDKPTPFPLERDLMQMTSAAVFLAHNSVEQKNFDRAGAFVNTFLIPTTYNAGGYLVKGGEAEYGYQCEPPVE